MPSPLTTRLNTIKAALAAAYPLRVVTRDFLQPANRPAADMQKGVYTLLAFGEKGFTNVAGYNAKDGRQDLVLVFDILKTEGDAKTPSTIEDAEFDAVDEIVAFLGNLPTALCLVELDGYVQSGQMDAPNGWVVFSLRYIP